MQDEFDFGKVLPNQPKVTVGAGPVEIRSVPIVQSQAKALVEAQKTRIAEFEHQTEELLAEAKALVVKDQATNEQAVKIGAIATKVIKDIDARVKDIIDPANTFVKDIRNFGRTLTARLENAKVEVGKKTANWRALVEMERRKAIEAAEKARKEVQKDINEQASQLGIDAPQIEKAIVKQEPVVTRTEFGSAYTRQYKKFRIVDESLIERQYLKPDEDKIQEAVEKGIEVRGVEAYIETKTVFRT